MFERSERHADDVSARLLFRPDERRHIDFDPFRIGARHLDDSKHRAVGRLFVPSHPPLVPRLVSDAKDSDTNAFGPANATSPDWRAGRAARLNQTPTAFEHSGPANTVSAVGEIQAARWKPSILTS